MRLLTKTIDKTLTVGIIFKTEKKKTKRNSAFAGSRTRVSRLEGENANRYTTNALQNALYNQYLVSSLNRILD